ncbi:MAG: TonB-dependent receptor, partial [Pseudomonadales bacterium]|nr:TonB-dependent receptor [Pseudomonadales bacterium]
MNRCTPTVLSRCFLFSLVLTILVQPLSYGAEDIEEIVVIGDTVGSLGLDSDSGAGSRLGLTIRETPAAIEVINKEVLRSRGYQQLTDAVQSLPGVISGNHPAAPSTFSMRGFTRGQVSILRDGLWVGPSSMVMRPQNTFNLERVEVLRGPASVMSGIGAIGSTVNTVARTAVVGADSSYDVLLSAGRWDSFQAGFGAGGSLSDTTGWRFDVSTYGAEGFVERTDPESTNVTGSFVWSLADDMELKLSADYLQDDVGRYFGTPLIPLEAARRPMTHIISTTTGETIDEDMRFRNYNVEDGFAESDQLFLRADYSWEVSENITLQNTLYKFDADREWVNAEGYAFCTEVVDVCSQAGEIQRYYGYFFVFHDQDQWGNRFTLNVDGELGGMENRFVVGAELLDIDFVRSRGFRRSIPPAPGDSVDPYNPVPGVYGQLELRGVSPTDIQDWAIFAENALQITDRFSLVGALRYEELDLDRANFNESGVDEGSGFVRTYDWWSWRLGFVFDLTESIALYGQYSDAVDPIGSNIFLVNSNNDFDLTSAEQWEIGLKASLGGGTE